VKNVFREFASIFLRRLPDRFVLVILVVSIVSMGSFAYENVGLPIQTASAQVAPDGANATSVAICWLSVQACFGDHILPDTINSSVLSAVNGTSRIAVNFNSLIYRIDPITGGLHHANVSHSVEITVQNGRVVSALENSSNLLDGPVTSPMSDVARGYC